MTLNDFLEYVKTRKALDTEEIHRFMDEMSNEARRVTFKLNTSYYAPDEVRALLSELFGKPVPPSLRVFPPFYTDFGKNIEIGDNVFINACCHFQDHGGVTLGDGCQIGHNCGFCNPRPRACARRPSYHISCAYRAWQECVGRFKFHYSARRDDW